MTHDMTEHARKRLHKKRDENCLNHRGEKRKKKKNENSASTMYAHPPTGCIIDVRSSVGMNLLHVVGPAESTENHDDVDREAEQTSAAAARISEGRPLATATTLR